MAKQYEHDYELPQLTVSEIAKAFGLSEQTIRFYHKKGILMPDARDKNGYRKYSLNATITLAKICFFRKAGISINEIRSYMKLDTMQDTSSYMHKLIEKLKLDMQETQNSINILERKCAYLDELVSQNITEEPQLITLPLRRYIYLSEEELTSFNNDCFFDYPLIFAYRFDDDGVIRKAAVGAYLGSNLPPAHACNVCELPEQQCLVCNFKGSYDKIYGKLAELYQSRKDIPLAPIAYAVNVVDHIMENDPNHCVVNIQLPILTSP